MIITKSFIVTFLGLVYIFKRTCWGDYERRHAIQARDIEEQHGPTDICTSLLSSCLSSVSLNGNASIIATVSYVNQKVKLWDVEQGTWTGNQNA
jgi:hypothetical protein